MFHPVGSQSPSVYWRRRLLLGAGIVVLIVLIVLTAKAVGGGSAAADTSAKRPSTPAAPVGSRSTSPPPSAVSPASSASSVSSVSSASSASGSAPVTGHASTPASTPPATASSATSPPASSAPPAACTTSQLAVTAVVGKSTYTTSDDPLLELQVTNTGSAPCVQDLSDKQVELRVYNGVSRVWGSHDCAVQPGTDPRTLAANTPVRVAISWSGKTSNAGCQDRQHVGAGSYTLYAALSGHTGKAAQFTIT